MMACLILNYVSYNLVVYRGKSGGWAQAQSNGKNEVVTSFGID